LSNRIRIFIHLGVEMNQATASKANVETNHIPEIPILTYGGAGRNNTAEFLEAASVYCQRTFGEIGLVVETGEFPDIPIPVRPNLTIVPEDAKELVLVEYREIVKQYSTRVSDLERQKIRVYAVIVSQLSKESKARLKQVVNWEDIDKTKCPRALIKAIRETHLTTETGFKLKDKYTVRTEYYSLRQETSESLARFKHRFDQVLKQFRAVAKAEEIPDDADQAIDFIKWLDKSRYGQLQVDMDNNAAMKIGEYPQDLQKAYTIVSQYRANEVNTGTVPPVNANVFAVTSTSSKETSEPDERENEKKNRKPRNKKKSNDGNETSKEEGDGDPSEQKVQRKPCPLCGRTTHWPQNCPEFKEACGDFLAKRKAIGTVGVHVAAECDDSFGTRGLVVL
jgi:hypothetical protein